MLCPVICSGIGGNVDIVEHGKTGLIFEVKNQARLQGQLEQALADPHVLKQYARALRSKIEQHYDQPIVHLYLRNKYRDVLGQKT
jgi:glycosyltransferase involved in cell wall biosynthesis